MLSSNSSGYSPDPYQQFLYEAKSFTISQSDYSQAANILSLQTYNNISLHHCLKPIPYSVVHKLKRTLTCLTFSSLTPFNNIVACVQNLSNLQHLFFKMVLIDKKFLLPSKPKLLKLPDLKSINFEHKLEEPYNDIFLLDFFMNNVTTQSLESFSFVEEDSAVPGPADAPPNHNNHFPSQVRIPTEPGIKTLLKCPLGSSSPSVRGSKSSSSFAPPFVQDRGESPDEEESVILGRFLYNNHKTLRYLRIRDHFIRIGNNFQVPGSEHDISSNSNNNSSGRSRRGRLCPLELLRLKHMTCSIDDVGQSLILKAQWRLEELVGTGFVFAFQPRKISSFLDTIVRNYETLTEIRLTPNIVLSPHENIGEASSSVIIDCQLFQECPQLQFLEIDLNIVEVNHHHHSHHHHQPPLKEKHELPLRKIGIVYNLQLLPNHLQLLSVSGHYIDPDEVQQLFSRLPSFYFLEHLSLATSSTPLGSIGGSSTFTLSLELIQILSKLGVQNLASAKFLGCSDEAEDDQLIKDFVELNGVYMERKVLRKSLCYSFLF